MSHTSAANAKATKQRNWEIFLAEKQQEADAKVKRKRDVLKNIVSQANRSLRGADKNFFVAQAQWNLIRAVDYLLEEIEERRCAIVNDPGLDQEAKTVEFEKLTETIVATQDFVTGQKTLKEYAAHVETIESGKENRVKFVAGSVIAAATVVVTVAAIIATLCVGVFSFGAVPFGIFMCAAIASVFLSPSLFEAGCDLAEAGKQQGVREGAARVLDAGRSGAILKPGLFPPATSTPPVSPVASTVSIETPAFPRSPVFGT